MWLCADQLRCELDSPRRVIISPLLHSRPFVGRRRPPNPFMLCASLGMLYNICTVQSMRSLPATPAPESAPSSERRAFTLSPLMPLSTGMHRHRDWYTRRQPQQQPPHEHEHYRAVRRVEGCVYRTNSVLWENGLGSVARQRRTVWHYITFRSTNSDDVRSVGFGKNPFVILLSCTCFSFLYSVPQSYTFWCFVFCACGSDRPTDRQSNHSHCQPQCRRS